MSDLLKLAEQCEQATGPDRELDAEIGRAVGAEPFAICDLGNVPVFASFTASLDAAITLAAGNEGAILREAMRMLSKRFDLHISFWPVNEPYVQWLARLVCAAALRSHYMSREG